jgi:hypothetical protein
MNSLCSLHVCVFKRHVSVICEKRIYYGLGSVEPIVLVMPIKVRLRYSNLGSRIHLLLQIFL